jgi:integrase
VLYRFADAHGDPTTYRLKIGSGPVWTLDAARAKAIELLREVDSQRNPATTWRKHAHVVAPAEGPLTFGKLAALFFSDCERRLQGGAGERQMPSLRQKTLAEWRRMYEHDLQAELDGCVASEITRADVKAILLPILRRAPVVCNRTQSFVARVYSFAVEEELVPASPVAGMKRRHDEGDGRDRVLSPTEIRVVWQAASERGADFGDVVKLALLTGLRLRNILHAKAEQFDLAAKTWTLPREAMKAGKIHIVPLPDLALEILRPRITDATTPFLFPSPKKKHGIKPIDSHGHAAARVRERADKIAGHPLPRWTIHDLKRTVGTGLREYLKPAVDRSVVALILAHVPEGPSATSRYDRAPMLDERREALDRWARWLKKTTSPLKEVSEEKRA